MDDNPEGIEPTPEADLPTYPNVKATSYVELAALLDVLEGNTSAARGRLRTMSRRELALYADQLDFLSTLVHNAL